MFPVPVDGSADGSVDGPIDGRGVRAVLFGLYNTLIPVGSVAERDAVVRAMAGDLGVDPEAYVEIVAASFDDRVRGLMADLPYTLRYLARKVGGAPTESQVEAAAKRRLEFSLSLHGATWAVPALRALKKRGFLLGVVSDCSPETPEVWPQSPLYDLFDTTSFSSETGIRKPAAGAYRVAAAALGVRTTECVFVGDGGSHELSGAEHVGMRVVRFDPPDPTQAVAEVSGFDDDWIGPVIDDLGQLVGMLDIPSPRVESARGFEVGNKVPWGSTGR